MPVLVTGAASDPILLADAHGGLALRSCERPFRGTSIGGTSIGGMSIGGTSIGGTSIGGTSIGGMSIGGTSIGGHVAERDAVSLSVRAGD